MALRTQQVIAYETGVTRTADPLGGSEYVESLTDRIEKEAREYIERIDAMGGTLRVIESGYMQGEVQNAAYEAQRKMERGESVVVGVNRFQAEREQAIPMFRLSPEVEQQQVARLREVRAARNARLVGDRLKALGEAARGTENLMPHIVHCCEAYATVGEISDALRAVFGEYQEGR